MYLESPEVQSLSCDCSLKLSANFEKFLGSCPVNYFAFFASGVDACRRHHCVQVWMSVPSTSITVTLRRLVRTQWLVSLAHVTRGMRETALSVEVGFAPPPPPPLVYVHGNRWRVPWYCLSTISNHMCRLAYYVQPFNLRISRTYRLGLLPIAYMLSLSHCDITHHTDIVRV